MQSTLMINYYYDKLLEFSSGNKSHDFIKRNEIIIKRELNNIINSNNHLLLNESILCYLSKNKNIINNLKSLSLNDENSFKVYMNYYGECLKERYKTIFCMNYNYNFRKLRKMKYKKEPKWKGFSNQYNLIDNNTKDVLTRASYFYHLRINTKGEYAFKIISSVLAYCHLNNIMDKFDENCSLFYESNNYIFDDLTLNGLDDNSKDNYLINRVFSMINSKYVKEKVIR